MKWLELKKHLEPVLATEIEEVYEPRFCTITDEFGELQSVKIYLKNGIPETVEFVFTDGSHDWVSFDSDTVPEFDFDVVESTDEEYLVEKLTAEKIALQQYITNLHEQAVKVGNLTDQLIATYKRNTGKNIS